MRISKLELALKNVGESLTFQNEKLDDSNSNKLITAIKEAKTLQTLKLTGVQLAGEGWTGLGQALKENESVESVTVNDTLSLSMLRDADLTRLELDHKKYSHEEAYIIAAFIPGFKSLEMVNLSHTQLGAQGLTAVLEAAKDLKSLTHLDFRNADLSTPGGEALAAFIADKKSVQELNGIPLSAFKSAKINLSDRNLGLAEASILASLFKGNKAVSELKLRGNRALGDAGLSVLATALKDNIWLRRLDVSQCGVLDNACLVELAKAQPKMFIDKDGKRVQ